MCRPGLLPPQRTLEAKRVRLTFVPSYQTSLPPQPSFSFLSASAGYCLNDVVEGVLCLTGW